MSQGAAMPVPREQAVVPAGHPWARLPILGATASFGGLFLLVLGSRGEPATALAAWLVAFVYFLSIALGCLYFTLIHTAMSGTWGVVVRRIAETSAATMPLFALLFVPLALGASALYPWAGTGAASDPLLVWKRPYLNETFFVLRAAVYFFVWSGAAAWFLRLSRRLDEGQDAASAARLARWSGPLLVPVALAHTFAAFDWLMSLDAHWYSTIFGVYSFSGSLLAGFAFLALAAVALRRSGLAAGSVGTEHFHDLGKLLFAFTAFWAYIAYSQYFLIWYGNIPEETSWFRGRLEGPWLAASVALALGHFVVPFFFLLPRAVKRSAPALATAAAWLLLMHLLDVVWLVVPSARAESLGLPLAGALLAVGGLFLAVFGWRLRRHPVLPLGDPRLAESLSFENV
jgi:hypothetical protein